MKVDCCDIHCENLLTFVSYGKGGLGNGEREGGKKERREGRKQGKGQKRGKRLN